MHPRTECAGYLASSFPSCTWERPCPRSCASPRILKMHTPITAAAWDCLLPPMRQDAGMTEDDLVASYLPPAKKRRERSRWRWMLGAALLSAILCGLGLLCAFVAHMPLWPGLPAFLIGLLAGFGLQRVWSENRTRRFLAFFVFFFVFNLTSDLLESWILGDRAHHLTFRFALFSFLLAGVILVQFAKFVREPDGAR